MQLLVNWAAWYQGEPACAGFEGGCEMLRGDGCALPPAAIKEVEMGTAPNPDPNPDPDPNPNPDPNP